MSSARKEVSFLSSRYTVNFTTVELSVVSVGCMLRYAVSIYETRYLFVSHATVLLSVF